jgi:hypothetical protein
MAIDRTHYAVRERPFGSAQKGPGSATPPGEKLEACATLLVVDETWFSRDLPVLDAVVGFIDREMGLAFPTVQEIADATAIDPGDVARAAGALEGQYVGFQRLMTGGDPAPWFFTKVYPASRVAVGQWPSGESMVDQIVTGLTEASLGETDDEKRSKLRDAASVLGGSARDIAVDVVAAIVSRHTGG